MTAYRLSPSQINLFLNEPSIWIINKFLGFYGEAGPAAKRGVAVEAALNNILESNCDYKTANAWMHEVFLKETQGMNKDDIEKERTSLDGMLEQTVELFLNIDDALLGTQVRLEFEMLGIPMLGFADYDYGSYYVDLKTTTRCPSSEETISSEHLRQVAIYKKASGKPQKLAYVTPKKYNLLTPTDEQLSVAEKEIHAAIRAMKQAYEIEEENGFDALAILYPPRDTKSFYWDTKTLTKAQEIWF